MRKTLYEPEHEAFRSSVRSYVEKEVVPHHAEWEKVGLVDRSLWTEAGKQGFLGMDVPEQYGGGGVEDFRYNAVLDEEIVPVGASGVGWGLHNDVVAPYLLELATEEQKARWLPGFCSGRDHHRDRHDGAGCQLGPAGHPHHRAARRRFLTRAARDGAARVRHGQTRTG